MNELTVTSYNQERNHIEVGCHSEAILNLTREDATQVSIPKKPLSYFVLSGDNIENCRVQFEHVEGGIRVFQKLHDSDKDDIGEREESAIILHTLVDHIINN
jgi:hypothetical protein